LFRSNRADIIERKSTDDVGRKLILGDSDPPNSRQVFNERGEGVIVKALRLRSAKMTGSHIYPKKTLQRC
jgi:hypothetical protein